MAGGADTHVTVVYPAVLINGISNMWYIYSVIACLGLRSCQNFDHPEMINVS